MVARGLFMSIKALVTVAAAVAGVGQAEAAVVQQDMLFTLNSAERIYSDGSDYYVADHYSSRL